MRVRVCCALALWLLTSGCTRSNTAAAAGDDVVTLAARVGPNNLDPRLANDEGSSRVAQLIFNPLVTLGDDLRVKPDLAERLDNPDPLTYIARLRRGVKFHDGHELTAADVIYTYGAFLDPAFISPYKGAYRVLASVKALDDYTVEFKLREPFTAFPVTLVTPPVVAAGSGDSLRTHPVGTGPYKFEHYSVDDQVVLSAFQDYWQGPPRNKGVIVKIIPDDTMRGLELRKGSADLVINDMPPDIVHQLERSGEFTITRAPGLDLSYIGFNMRDPILRDARVRHAISYAIDRNAIVEYLRRGLARPAVGLIPPQGWAFEPDVRRFELDRDRARRLLDEAGYADPDGNGPLPRLRLSLKVSTNEEARLQATVVQQDLARVGIDLDVRSYEFATFYADVVKGNFQLFSLQWVGGALVDPDILRRVFHSQQVPPAGFNRGHYVNPRVDALIELATQAPDEPTRKRYYGDAQRLIAEDAPYIGLWNRINVIVAQRHLSGLRINPTGDIAALRDVRKGS